MSNYNDRVSVDLFVNGRQACDEIDRTRKKAEDLANQINDALANGDKKRAARLQRELDAVNKQLGRVESAAKGAGIVLNDLNNANLTGLRNTLRFLRKEIAATKPGTEQWKQYAEQIQAVKERIAELSEEMNGSESAWERFKSWAHDSRAALMMISDGIGAAIDMTQEYVDAFASMDSEMANVQKYTGMTTEEVAALNEEFKKMDTRTSREELNKLAQEAGRLGKTSQEDVMGFVRAADQINVALDDLGEGATLTLSKLTGVFGDEQKYGTEQALIKVGSVINDLSQNCSAGAPFLAEFASRMGGVGSQANMTIPQIMAFGAVLDSAGMNVEASSTALSQVIVRFMQEPAKYARVAGMDVKKFSELLKTDVNGALIMFLETLNKAGGIDNLSPMFKDMGETGSQAIATLSTLAGNIDMVKQQQIAANEAFEAGTSIANEFNVQNNTVAAALDKQQKAATELRVELGERLTPIYYQLVNVTTLGLKAITEIVKFLYKHRVAVATVTTAIIAYTVATKAATIAENIATAAKKARAVAMVALNKITLATSIVTNALRIVYNKLTGDTVAATEAQVALGLAMKATPWGAILTAIGAAIAAFQLFGHTIGDTTESYDALNDAKVDAEVKYNDEKIALEQTTKKLREFNGSKAEEAQLVQSLNEKYGPVLGTYSTVADWLRILTTRGDEYCTNLKKQIILEGKQEQVRQYIAKAAKLRAEGNGEAITIGQTIWRMVEENARNLWNGSDIGVSYSRAGEQLANEKKRAEESMAEYYELLAQNLQEEINAEMGAIAPVSSVVTPTITPTPTPPGYTSQVVANKEKKKREAEARREAAKAKKDFKDGLDTIKAELTSANNAAVEAYRNGTIDYLGYVKQRGENEQKYYDKALGYYEAKFKGQKNIYLEDDKDYQALQANKLKSAEKFADEIQKLTTDAINDNLKKESTEIERRYEKLGELTIAQEVAREEELFKVREKALQEKMKLYGENEKEYTDLADELATLRTDHAYAKEKIYLQAVNALRKEYDKKSAQELFTLEKQTLDELLKQKIISAKEYEKYLEALTAKYASERPDGYDPSSYLSEDAIEYDDEAKALKRQWEARLLTEEEYLEKLQKLREKYTEKAVEGIRKNGGEWAAMAADIHDAFAKLFANLGGSTGDVLASIGEATKAVTVAVAAGMQMASEFAKAESDIQTKAVEKRYTREIELAQGNAYKTAKLEKEKEAEIAKIKNEASRRQYTMQIIQTIAQTFANAVSAYGAALKIGPLGIPLAPVVAAVATAQGLAQVALLRKQQQASEATGYSQGGFTRPGGVNEPAGIVHAGEWVASQKLVNSPRVRPLLEALDYAQRTNTIGRLNAFDVSRSIRANDSLVRIAESDGSGAIVAAAVAQNAAAVVALNDRLNEPFVTISTVTGDHGTKQAQDEYSRLMNNITPKSRR